MGDDFNWLDFIKGASPLLGLFGGGAALANAYDRLGNIGEAAQQGAMQIAQQGLEQSQFQPFTVRSAMGGAYRYNPETGTVSMGLSPAEQALQNRMFGQAAFYSGGPPVGAAGLTQAGQQALARGQGLLGQGPFGRGMAEQAARQAYGLGGEFMTAAGMPTAEREAEVYERIRATQTPEEERQRLALEERLARQGRLGVQTAQYGTTPEQFTMDKARAETQNQAMLAAMQQAQQEQAQQAALGSQYAGLGANLASQRQALAQAGQAQALQAMQAGQGLLGGGLGLRQAQQQLAQQALAGAYMPQAQLLNVQQASQIFPQLQQRGQLYGAGLFGEGAMGGLEALLGAGLGQANLMGQLGTGLLGGLATPTDSYGGLSELLGTGLESLFGPNGLFGTIFG